MANSKSTKKETVPRKNGRLTKAEATKRLPKGRPAGAKNKATLFKEVVREGFEATMKKDIQKVIGAVVYAACGTPLTDRNGDVVIGDDGKPVMGKGDMAAAKLLFDRVLPTTKAIDLDQLENSKGLTISINVGELTGHPDKPSIDGEVLEND